MMLRKRIVSLGVCLMMAATFRLSIEHNSLHVWCLLRSYIWNDYKH